MTVQEILASVAKGKLSAADAEKLIAAQSRPTRTIKRNQSGGLFVRDESFQCYSKTKEKHYTGSFNMDWAVAVAVFGPEGKGLRDTIAAYLASESGTDAETAAAQVKLAKTA